MKRVVFSLLAVTAGCAPSRTAVFGPVDREINRRLNLDASWSSDERVPAAITALLELHAAGRSINNWPADPYASAEYCTV